MVTALVLINAATDKVPTLAEGLIEISGVDEVFSVAGRYDLVALIRVPQNEDVADVVSNRMRGLEGITATETLISFRCYSRKDLESVFSIGMEN